MKEFKRPIAGARRLDIKQYPNQDELWYWMVGRAGKTLILWKMNEEDPDRPTKHIHNVEELSDFIIKGEPVTPFVVRNFIDLTHRGVDRHVIRARYAQKKEEARQEAAEEMKLTCHALLKRANKLVEDSNALAYEYQDKYQETREQNRRFLENLRACLEVHLQEAGPKAREEIS